MFAGEFGDDVRVYVQSSSDEQTESCERHLYEVLRHCRECGITGLPPAGAPLLRDPQIGVWADKGRFRAGAAGLIRATGSSLSSRT